MAEVLFTHSYFLRFDPKQWKLQQPYAPLATMQAMSVIREAGWSVSLFDTMFCRSAEEISDAIDREQPKFLVIYDDGFNYLTKMCLTNMREACFRMIQIAKQKNCIVIVSSSDSSDHYKNYLEQGADFVMLGEGEITLRELLYAYEKGFSGLEQLGGIAFEKDGEVIKTAGREILRDLDQLPLPAWDLLDLSPYKKAWQKSTGLFFNQCKYNTRLPL